MSARGLDGALARDMLETSSRSDALEPDPAPTFGPKEKSMRPVSRFFGLAVVAGVVVAGMSSTARANGFGVAIGGAVSGSVSGAVVIGGGVGVAVGGIGVAVYDDGFAEPPPPMPYQPPPYQPPPCEVYACQPVYYAPPPQPVYYAPQPVIVAQHRPERPLELGIGLSASSTALRGEGSGPDQELEGGALLLRLRGEVLELELELGHDESVDGIREEDRVGAALLFHVVRTGRLSGYGLVGLGTIESTTPYDDGRRFAYGSLGAGLALRFGPFSIAGDVRWQARRLMRDDDGDRLAGGGPAASTIYAPEKERGVEARLLGVVYF